jgi:hypothetical protein
MSPGRYPNLSGDPNAAPRCGARTRQATACRQPAMPNGRCRLHGGRSTGPRTADGLERIRAARTKHGRYSAEIRQFAELVRMLKSRAKAVIEKF